MVHSPLFRWEQVLYFIWTKVLESGGRMEKLIAQVAWSPVLSFHSLWWFGVQCHLLVSVHCVFWKPTSLHPFTKKFWSTSCFLLLTSFLKMLISFSSPHYQNHQKLVKWPPTWFVGVLDWPANSPDLNPIENLPYHLSSVTNWSPPCHAELRR